MGRLTSDSHINGILILPQPVHHRPVSWWEEQAQAVGGGICGNCKGYTTGEYLVDVDGSWYRKAVVERCRCGWLAYHWTQEQAGPIEWHPVRGPRPPRADERDRKVPWRVDGKDARPNSRRRSPQLTRPKRREVEE